MKQENPFLITGYQSPEFFCDRKKEIELLKSYAQDSMHTALFSTRRLGKTAMIFHLIYLLRKEKIKCMYFDLMPTITIEDFAYHFAKSFFNQTASISQKYLHKINQMLKAFVPSLAVDPTTGQLSFEFKLNKADEIYNDIEVIFDIIKKSKEKYLISLDEFQQILSYPAQNFEGFLRTHIQFMKNASFIFSGSKKHLLLSIFGEYSKPLWQSCAFMELKPIDRKIYSDFIRSKFKTSGRTIDDSALDFVYDSTRGITYFVQLFCNYLFKETKGKVNLEIAEKILDKIVTEREGYFINLLELLTQKQIEVLTAISIENGIDKPLGNKFITKHKLGAASTVKSVLDALVNKEIINYDNGKYNVADVLLSVWLRGRKGY